MVHAPEEFLALVRLLDRIEAKGPGSHPAWELRHRFFRALTRPVGPRGLNAVRNTDWGRILGMGPDVAEGLEAEILAFLAVRWSCEAIAYAPGATMIDRARHLVGDWLEGPFPVRSSR